MKCSHPDCNKDAVFSIHTFNVCEEHAYRLCICLECGKLEWEENLKWEHNTVTCEACRTTIKCTCCNTDMKPRHAITADNGDIICADCAERHYVHCHGCGRSTKKDEGKAVVKEGHWVQLCITCGADNRICPSCTRIIKPSQVVDVVIDGERHVGCKGCLSIRACSACGKAYPSSQTPHPNIPKNRLQNNTFCLDCGKDKWSISLGDYRHQRVISKEKFLPAWSKTGLFFGLELEQELTCGEVQRNTDIAKLWTTLPDLIVDIKRDGSLSNGQEIVTFPATFEYLMSQDLSPLITIPKLMLPLGTGAGFHAHMSRAAFTTTHLYKFCDFLYRYSYLLQLVGGRNFTTYCKKSSSKSWAKLKAKALGINNLKVINPRARISARLGSAPQFERYDIVNLTETTAEVRSFNTPDTVEKLRYRIQFLHAVYMFTKNNKLIDKDLGASFVTYVTERSKLYPELAQFLADNSRGLVTSFSKIAAGLEV